MAAGSIVFDLLMRTGSFETDTKRAEKRLRELKKEAEAIGKAVAAVAATGFAALTYGIKQSINAMDDMSKSAQKVGVTTEALSALRYAADLSGVSTEALQQGMLKLAKGAADGNDAFAAMGISVRDASGHLKGTDSLLKEVSSKFAGYEDGAEKSALAVELFGKSGAELIPLLNGGADGLESMADEARKLGIVIDDNTAKAAEGFNDNLSRLEYSIKGVSAAIAADLLQSLLSLTDGLVETAKGSGVVDGAAKTLASGLRILASATLVVGGTFKAVGSLIGNSLGVAVTTVTAIVQAASKSIASIGEALRLAAQGDFAAAGRALSGVTESIGAGYQSIADGVAYTSQQLNDDIAGTAKLLTAVWDDEARKAEASATKPSGGIVAPVVAGVKRVKQAVDDAAKEYKRLVEEGKRLAESVMTQAEKLEASRGNIGRLSDAGVISPETTKRALAEAQSVYDEYVSAQREALTSGLLTEEQDIRASYERRKQMILKLTEATEAEKRDAILTLSEMQDREVYEAQYRRYADLLSEEERLTHEYMQRKRAIVDDDAISQEQRNAYLVSLAEGYHAKMAELDKADAERKAALMQAQVDMVSTAFGNMADIAKAFAGEQSKEYKALFALAKSFAIADITVKQSQAIAKAWGENNYWTAIGITVGLAAQFAGLLSSVGSASFGGALAAGGPVNAGRSYLVGERGPEMFTPDSGGRVIPNDALTKTQAQPNIRIVNAYDNDHIGNYLGSSSGERVLTNFVKRNGALFRSVVAAG